MIFFRERSLLSGVKISATYERLHLHYRKFQQAREGACKMLGAPMTPEELLCAVSIYREELQAHLES